MSVIGPRPQLVRDCSTDEESRKVIKEYEAKDERVKPYYKKKNEGLAAALNYGIRKASGKYIVRFDTDDICFSKRFEIQIDYMEKHPDINISSSFVEIFDGKKGIVATAFNDGESVKAQLLFSCYIPHVYLKINIKRDICAYIILGIMCGAGLTENHLYIVQISCIFILCYLYIKELIKISEYFKRKIMFRI